MQEKLGADFILFMNQEKRKTKNQQLAEDPVLK